MRTSPHYDARRRCFLPYDESDRHAIRVLPSRFAAFLAVCRRGDASVHCPMPRCEPPPAGQAGDTELDFWQPIHKLFSGPECLRGIPGAGLDVRLAAFHFNEKLKRFHLRMRELVVPDFDTGVRIEDLDEAPFVLREGIAEFATIASYGSGVVVPVVHQRLVEAATFRGAPLTFNVPSIPEQSDELKTFDTSLWLRGRLKSGRRVLDAPEYIHVRHQIKDGVQQDIARPQAVPVPTPGELVDAVKSGEFTARHYLDFTGDGWVSAECEELRQDVSSVQPAYSIVAAPDFFLGSSQRELMRWWMKEVPVSLRDDAWSRSKRPLPLSDERLPANVALPSSPFTTTDVTVTALVPLYGSGSNARAAPKTTDAQRSSHLPDDAAGTFAPGWDTAIAESPDGHLHLANFGLGSPFPEDAKLCAALSAYWPAAAPDSSRGALSGRPTVAPLTDEENGQAGSASWDGVDGPTVVTDPDGQEWIESESYQHVDYVNNSLSRKFTLVQTGRITAKDYQARILAMILAYRQIGALVTKTHWDGTQERFDSRRDWVVLSCRRLTGIGAELQDAEASAQAFLLGELLYRFEICRRQKQFVSPERNDRMRMALVDRHIVYVDVTNLRAITLGRGWITGQLDA